MADKARKTKSKAKRVYFGTKHIDVEDSVLVDKVFYDPETNTLDAVFKKGSRYRYRGIKPKLFSQFVLAKSMGRFYNSNIRSKFTSEKVT